jgi:hypothetical protein
MVLIFAGLMIFIALQPEIVLPTVAKCKLSQVLSSMVFNAGVLILRDSREHFLSNMEFNIIPNNGNQGYSEVPEWQNLPHGVKSQLV